MDRTGQFGVVRTNGWAGWFIRLGTRSQVNHAFVFVDNDTIVEAQPGGAIKVPVSKYKDAKVFAVSAFDLGYEDAYAIADAAHDLIGTPYNFLDILALTVASFGIRWKWLGTRAQNEKALICSQLVARVYTKAGRTLYPNRPDSTVTPGDLLILTSEQATRTEFPS